MARNVLNIHIVVILISLIIIIPNTFGNTSLEHDCCFLTKEAKTSNWKCECRSYPINGLLPHIAELIFSPNMQRFSYQAASPSSFPPDHVVVDGKVGKKYDDVGAVVFSPDSKRLAYAAKKGDKHFVVLDGVEGPCYYGDILEIVFSPDSKHIAYSAEKDDNSVLILDGKEIAIHDWISIYEITFSPDSKHLAYKASDNHEESIFLDGKRLEEFDELHGFSLKFSPDSSKITYTFHRGQEWFVVFGEEKYGPYEEVEPVFLEISPDSKKIAFPIRRGINWFLISGKKEYGPYAVFPHPKFSPDSKSLACYGGYDYNAPVYVNDQIIGRFDMMSDFIFSHDSKHFAFVGERNNCYYIVEDGLTIKECNDASISYSPDSKRLVAIVIDGEKEYFFEKGTEKTEKTYNLTYRGETPIHFSPDSKHLAYWERSADEHVLIIDGLETLRFYNPDLWEYELFFAENNHLYGYCMHVTDKGQKLLEKDPNNYGTENFSSYFLLNLFHIYHKTENK